MPAYLIADLEILDPVAFEEYRQQVPATIAAHGGRYLARGGSTVVFEGNWRPKRLVILEFPSLLQLNTWWESPEYRPLRALRERSARTNVVVSEGLRMQ